MKTWPMVVWNDDGIRPAGPADACFYCNEKIGSLHGADCVIVQKKIRARYIIEVDLTVPYHWTAEDFEFHRNDGSWCADNAIGDIERHQSMTDGKDCTPCLCDRFRAEFVSVLDDQPIREVLTAEKVAEGRAMRDFVNRERNKK